jgi:hypothetical protein
MSITDDNVTPEIDKAMTIRDFCVAEHLSLPSYFKIRKMGLGPRETRVPGTNIIRISAHARAEWHTRLDEMRQSEAAELEAARRYAQTVEAGKRAVASASHVSKQRRRS